MLKKDFTYFKLIFQLYPPENTESLLFSEVFKGFKIEKWVEMG